MSQNRVDLPLVTYIFAIDETRKIDGENGLQNLNQEAKDDRAELYPSICEQIAQLIESVMIIERADWKQLYSHFRCAGLPKKRLS
jgi:hypothetical protein